MLLATVILSAVLATLTTRLYMRKQIQKLHRIHENELTQTYFASYNKGHSEGFKEGREAAKLQAIRMFN